MTKVVPIFCCFQKTFQIRPDLSIHNMSTFFEITMNNV